MLYIRAFVWWFLLMAAAILNAGFREAIISPVTGSGWALTVSGITGSVLIIIMVSIIYRILKTQSTADEWKIGIIWLLITIVFEFVFGRFVMDKSWASLLNNYNILTGNLWIVMLAVVAASVRIAGFIRNYITEMSNNIHSQEQL